MITTTTIGRIRRVGMTAAATAAVAAGIALIAPTTAHADVKDACTGVKATCTIVAHTDVTGDGKKDSVGIVIRQADGGVITRYQVRVRTAQGKLIHKADKHADWQGKVFFGAAPIDGEPGKELVVGHIAGAHTAFYHVLAYRHGKLVLLKAPKLPAAAAGLNTYGRSWIDDGAVSSFAGIHRTASHGQVKLVENFGSRDPSAAKYTGWHVSYHWSGDHWALTSYHRKSWTEKQSESLWGWHVKGLPR